MIKIHIVLKYGDDGGLEMEVLLNLRTVLREVSKDEDIEVLPV